MSRASFSAGVVIFHVNGEPRLLILRAYRDWDFPKGQVEPGESPFSAACREVFEETGLTGLEFPWSDEFRETHPYSGGKIARYYLARCAATSVYLPVNPALGRPEHHEFRWVGCQTAKELVAARLKPILDWACGKIVALQAAPRI